MFSNFGQETQPGTALGDTAQSRANGRFSPLNGGLAPLGDSSPFFACVF